MQANGKSKRYLEKIESKLSFLKNSVNYDLSQEQKDWIQTNSLLFHKMFEILQKDTSENEYKDNLCEDLYDNVRTAKTKVISWLKFKTTDIELFKQLRKEKGESWIPMVDQIPLPPRLSEIRTGDLWNINFPCMSYTNEELCQFSEMIFKEQNILVEFNVGAEKLSKIIERVCLGYNVPAYHNFSHGFNVFQMFYSLIKTTELERTLDKTEVFASLLAALGHDINHRGYNNAYEVKLRTGNALNYFDNAPLENMHASILIKILKDPEINFFDCLPDANKKAQFRDLATAVILATDMTKHNRLLQKFTENVKATVEYRKLKAANQPVEKHIEDKIYVMEKPADKKRILKNLVHACDIGNPCQKYENYIYWGAIISQEFDYQAKKEEKRGVEVIPTLKYKDAAGFYGGQLFFSKILTLPLWEQVKALLGGAATEAVQNLQDNLKRLEEEKTKASSGN